MKFFKDHGTETNNELIDFIKSNNPYKLIITHSYNVDDSFTDNEMDDIIDDKLELLKSYYDKSDLPESINIDFLKKITTKIYNEVIE